MGYTTEFSGTVSVVPPLNAAEVAYLRRFSVARHDGGEPGMPPRSYYCQWVPTEDGAGLEWDQVEKFYDSVEWMAYLIDHLLRPGAVASLAGDPQFAGFTFDHVLNGVIDADGEARNDRWRLVVNDNVVRRIDAVITFPETLWAMHVLGPDDIVAMPDQATAEAKAAEVNAIAEMLRQRPTASDLDPHLSAAVIEWTGTAAEHAADLAENGTEYAP
jgi:hypothetical protein